MPNIFPRPQTRKYAIEQSDLSSLNSLNKNEHYKSASKNIQNGHQNPTKKHSETSLMSKVPSKKSTILKVLKKSVTSFPRLSFGRDTTCLTKSRQRTIRKISLLIEYGRARFDHISSLTILDHAKKGQFPTLKPPSFSKHFSNIYLFPDLTIFVLTTLFRRRFQS